MIETGRVLRIADDGESVVSPALGRDPRELVECWTGYDDPDFIDFAEIYSHVRAERRTMSESSAEPVRALASIEIVGGTTVDLDAEVLGPLPTTTRQVSVVCATGHREVATWTGVDVSALCEVAEAPPETTHVVIDSHDDYRMAVPIVDAFDGLLAFEKDGKPLTESTAYDSRFVAPDVDGARDVKGVRRVEFHALDPSSDPDALENVEPTDDRYAPDRE